MLGTFFGLEISVRGLRTQQAAVEVASHNIANSNTPGYSRQRVDMIASNPLEVPGLMSANPNQIGTGVQIQNISRLRDNFLDEQYRNQNQYVGQWNVQQNVMEKIGAIVNEPSDTGISTAMKTFWDAWGSLGANAGNSSAMMELRQDAVSVTTTLNQIGQQFSQLKDDLNTQMDATTSQANAYLSQIAGLNHEIDSVQGVGASPNDLLDQRDELLDKLSQFADVSVTDGPNGYQVSMSGQVVLQDETVTRKITVPADPTATQPNNELWTTNIKGGQIKGIADAMSSEQDYASYFDTMANQLATGPVSVKLQGDWTFPAGDPNVTATLPDGSPVTGAPGVTTTNGMVTVPAGTVVQVNGLNGVVRLGYSQAGQNDDATKIPDFFVSNDGQPINAANIAVGVQAEQIGYALRPKAVTDAAGNTSYTAIDGDGTLAMTVNSLKSAKFTFPNPVQASSSTSTTIDDFLQSVVGRMGIDGQEANQQVQYQSALANQLDSKRQETSAVSIDEEMANMVRYQQAYNASAKMISTIDQMLSTLINSTGH